MRHRILLLLLLLAVLAPAATAQWAAFGTPSATPAPPAWPSPLGERPAAGDPAELRVRRGWACVIRGEAQDWFTPQDGVQTVGHSIYLELGTGAEVELSWSGSASVRLTGPAGVFVEPAAQPFGGRMLGFRRLNTADVEIRRGALTITLPRGQRLLPGASAFRLTGRPGGLVDLRHWAGAPIELDIGSRFTFPVPAGAHRRLPECVAAPAPLSAAGGYVGAAPIAPTHRGRAVVTAVR
ncbi:MAG: hypothetical protein AAFZ65_07880 [Planctomycetota bacterium]